MERLADIKAIRLTEDDETGRRTLDTRRLNSAILVLVNGLLDLLVSSSGVDRDELITEMRRFVDENVTPDMADEKRRTRPRVQLGQ